MATTKTLDDLLHKVLKEETITAWAVTAGISPYTLLRLRNGLNRSCHRRVRVAIAAALKKSLKVVDAAIEESRRQALQVAS